MYSTMSLRTHAQLSSRRNGLRDRSKRMITRAIKGVIGVRRRRHACQKQQRIVRGKTPATRFGQIARTSATTNSEHIEVRPEERRDGLQVSSGERVNSGLNDFWTNGIRARV